MAASVNSKYALTLNVDETLALGLDHASDPQFTHTLGAHAATLTASTTPPVTKTFSKTLNLVGGIVALDLTSLAGPSGTTVDLTGLKIQNMKLFCPNTNTGSIEVKAKDGTTGYNLFGPNNAFVTVQSIAAAAYTVTANGTSADLLNAETADVIYNVGVVTDGTHTPKLQESINDSDWTDVAAGDQIGTLSALSSATIQRVRYIGTSRYLRAVNTVTGGPATGAVLSASIVSTMESMKVLPGMAVLHFADDETEDVDSTHKDITFTGTGTETIQVQLVAG